MKRNCFILVILTLLLFLQGTNLSASSTSLVFSEVLYDSTTPESEGEWIEIYNTTYSDISVDGRYLK
ncbi:MAG: lamin tail domain-containing protein [bacterium]|nr:lamin tail domain-containing protein [bacterium]